MTQTGRKVGCVPGAFGHLRVWGVGVVYLNHKGLSNRLGDFSSRLLLVVSLATRPDSDTRDRCGSSFRASASASACPAPSCRRLPSSYCPGSATPVSTTSRHSARTSRSGSRRRWSGVGLIRWRSCLSTGRTGCGSRAASWTPTSGQERARLTAGRSAGTSSAPVRPCARPRPRRPLQATPTRACCCSVTPREAGWRVPRSGTARPRAPSRG